jgi:hypothetical protein
MSHGGVQNVEKCHFLGPGGPGGQKHKFFEILQFSTKAPPLFDPQNRPYKNAIPHK